MISWWEMQQLCNGLIIYSGVNQSYRKLDSVISKNRNWLAMHWIWPLERNEHWSLLPVFSVFVAEIKDEFALLQERANDKICWQNAVDDDWSGILIARPKQNEHGQVPRMTNVAQYSCRIQIATFSQRTCALSASDLMNSEELTDAVMTESRKYEDNGCEYQNVLWNSPMPAPNQ